MIDALKQRLHARSTALLLTMEAGLERIMLAWLAFAVAASALRVAVSPAHGGFPDFAALAPYVLLIFAPVVSMALALRWFAASDRLPQPVTRLARVGAWRQVSRYEAQRHPLYGATGIMVSLLVGNLLNVPVRAAEFLAAMPAVSGPVPAWLDALRLMMTADVVILSSLYTIAFVAALRRVPLFPRLLVAVWLIDLAMQLATAQLVTSAPGLPVTVGDALHRLLDGNVAKVLVSAALWLPYLLLSARVNVTYRHRVPA
jgi:Protein of unknown function (DUF2569)